jgi:UDP-glucose 4-epimerase
VRYCVTGGCGFIGTTLVEALIEQKGSTVVVLDNLSACGIDLWKRRGIDYTRDETQRGVADLVLIEGDIMSRADVERAVYGCEIVYHLAANTSVPVSVRTPIFDAQVNSLGTLNVLEAARHGGVCGVILASTAAVYGDSDDHPVNEVSRCAPTSPYGLSKYAAELYARMYGQLYGIRSVVLRFGNVYGPGSDFQGSVIPEMFRSAVNSKVLRITGDGSQTRDFVFIGDLVQALLASERVMTAAKDNYHDLFCLASGSETSIQRLADLIRGYLASKGVCETTIELTQRVRGDISRSWFDVNKAINILKWSSVTTIEDGIKLTLDSLTHTNGTNHGFDNE